MLSACTRLAPALMVVRGACPSYLLILWSGWACRTQGLPLPHLCWRSIFRLRVLALGRKHNYSYHSAPLQHSPLFLSVAPPGLGVLLCGSWTPSLSGRARSALGRSRFHGHHPFHWNFQLNHEGQELARSPPHTPYTHLHIYLCTHQDVCLYSANRTIRKN